METLPHEKQICDYVKAIEHLKKQNQNNPLFNAEIKKLENKLELLKNTIYSDLTPWQRIQICRHSGRPHTLDYISNICESFQELCGDRTYANDTAVVGGVGKIDGIKCVIIGQEKGKDTKTRIERNFGMPKPEGYRKALRLLRLADKFNLPVLSLVDTPGAFPGLEAEERGQGWAIAENLREMSRTGVPIILAIIGEASSGGALGIGVGDVVGMLEHAYFSVISPEGCASILWKDPAKKVEAASALKLNSENLMQFGVIDEIIKEPKGGAHHDPIAAYRSVKKFFIEQWEILRTLSRESLLEQRYYKYRQMGSFVRREV